MQQHAVKRAVIVGGGFIGLEMAENLHHAGAEVAVVEMADQVMGLLTIQWRLWFTSIYCRKE